MPINRDRKLIIIKIFEFLSPEYLKTSNSLLSKSFIKKNCVASKNIKGNISKIIEGEFKRDRSKVKLITTSISLKNSSSDNKFKMNTKLSITKST
jgi:hypothetical protein